MSDLPLPHANDGASCGADQHLTNDGALAPTNDGSFTAPEFKKLSDQFGRTAGLPPDIDAQAQVHDPHHRETYLAGLYVLQHGSAYAKTDSGLRWWDEKDKLWKQENFDAHLTTAVGAFLHARGAAVVNDIRARLQSVTDSEQIPALQRELKHAEKELTYLCKGSTVNTVARLVKARLAITLPVVVMDADPELLAVGNGLVVNLRTGELRPRRREDYISRYTPVPYDPDVDYGWWEKTVLEMSQGDNALALFLKVWAGYCMTGLTSEQCMLILYGGGSNGKNVLLDGMRGAFGQYADVYPRGALDELQNGSDNNTHYALAGLCGLRLACASETSERSRLSEASVKAQTGDDVGKGRHPHGDFFTFHVTHKIMLATNHTPEIRGTDEGIWRRIRLVPMLAHFGTEEQVAEGEATAVADTTLESRIKTPEGKKAVLAWAAAGARMYLGQRAKSTGYALEPFTPMHVRAATDKYRQGQDILGAFLRDVTDPVPPAVVQMVKDAEALPNSTRFRDMTMDERLRIETTLFYRMYRIWCSDNGHQPLAQTRFGQRLMETRRRWEPAEEGGAPRHMSNLEKVKSAACYVYRYLRLSEMGNRLMNEALARDGLNEDTRP